MWTTRRLHAAPAVRISWPCTVCTPSYLPICPVRSLFSGASTHRGTSLRSVSKHLTTNNSFFHSSNGLLFMVINCISVCASCSGGCFLFSEPLLAGLPQTVKFTVLMGHYSLKKGDALQFSNTETMPILPSSSCTAHIRNPAAGSCTFVKKIHSQIDFYASEMRIFYTFLHLICYNQLNGGILCTLDACKIRFF